MATFLAVALCTTAVAALAVLPAVAAAAVVLQGTALPLSGEASHRGVCPAVRGAAGLGKAQALRASVKALAVRAVPGPVVARGPAAWLAELRVPDRPPAPP